MPVRDLSDRVRTNRLGIIRLGEKEPNASGSGEHPVARPYFVIPDELKSKYGEQPTELKIVFLDDDEELISNQYYRLYNVSHGLVCKGDGYKADALLDADELVSRGGDVTAPMNRDVWAHGRTRGRQATQNVVRREIECLGAGYDGKPACPMYGAEGCGVKLFLQAAVVGAPGLGTYQINTGSVVSIQAINGAIALVKRLTGGRVAGIPFLMKRVKTEVAPPPDMKKKTVWTVALEVDPALDAGRLLTQASKAPIHALLPPIDELGVYEPFNDEDVMEGELAVHGDGAQQGGVTTAGSGTPLEPAASPTSPTPIAPTQKQAVVKGLQYIAALDKAAVEAAYKHLRATWPHCFGTMSNNVNALSSSDAEGVLSYIKALQGATGQVAGAAPASAGKGGSMVPPAPASACPKGGEHEPKYDEKGTVMRCSKCGLALEGPDAQTDPDDLPFDNDPAKDEPAKLPI